MHALLLIFFKYLGNLIVLILGYVGVMGVSYVFANEMFTLVVDYVEGNFTALPPQVMELLGLMKVDVAINIILSAVYVRLTLKAGRALSQHLPTK